MGSTRTKVLQTLLTHPRCTVYELAELVGISPISIRHHLANLLAESLVASEDERHGIGRPRQVFFLTEKGIEQFPTRYVRLTLRLLQQLKETLPETTFIQLFKKMAEQLAKEMADDANASQLSMRERLDLIKDLLNREGFNIAWEQADDCFYIHESSCPYYYIGQNHPEVCTVDQVLISTVLNIPAEKTRCILNGDNHCTYVIPTSLLESKQ
jgi:predicted ArsR family transcriptional regulator